MVGPTWKRSVPLPSSVRLVWHETEAYPQEVPIGELYAHLEFPPSVGPLPYVVGNMIMTQNGEATVDGKSVTIGTRVDGLVLTRLRAATDAVLVGAGTFAAEDITGVLPDAEVARRTAAGRPPRLLIALLASQLAWADDILARRFFTESRFDKVILTGQAARAEHIRRIEARGVEVVRIPSESTGRPDIAKALGALAARGVRCLVSEGGPRVLASLFRVRAVREYFLTTNPLVTGSPRPPRPIGEISDGEDVFLFSRISRHEYEFQDPRTLARLVEAYDRFRVVYPE
jgi:riboflavin biosynthesis pyrimidine reductase